MIAEYDRVDIEAARFRKALLEDVGDPVDELTLSVAAMVPEEYEDPHTDLGGPVVMEGVVEVPDSLLKKQDLLTSKVDEISKFARGLGIDARFTLEDSRDVVDGKHAAMELDAQGQTDPPS